MSLIDHFMGRRGPQPQPRYMEMVDLVGLTGMCVTEDPRGHAGIRMWCGYCCKPLHYDYRHMGAEPFLNLMVKMADAHRMTDCAAPEGPFVHSWSPRTSPEWHRWVEERIQNQEREA